MNLRRQFMSVTCRVFRDQDSCCGVCHTVEEARVGGRVLDSESSRHWRVFEPALLRRIVATARFGGQRGRLITPKFSRMLSVRRSRTARRILSNECSDAETHVDAAVFDISNRIAGRLAVPTVLRDGRSRVTPYAAQHRGALRSSESKHD